MITLYQLPCAFGLPVSVSPYCTKLELYLRLTKREHGIAPANLRQSPNRKVPYVEWPDGRRLADSGEIIRELEGSGGGLDSGLDGATMARGEEYQALAQGPLYFSCLYSRFVEDAGWKFQKEAVREILPPLLAPLIAKMIRRSQKKRCRENGFDRRESYANAIQAIKRLSSALGDRSFFLRDDAPNVADCAVWANLLHIAFTRAESPARMAVRNDRRLREYIDRVAEVAAYKLPPLVRQR